MHSASETIEILMATCNGGAFVREQIESIQAQSWSDWRLLVSDDCSADDTVAIVEEMASCDSRIFLVGKGVRHGSAQANFRWLVAQSSARHVMFADQDDVWLPGKVELTRARMLELEEEAASDVPCLVFTDMKVVDAALREISPSFWHFSHLEPSRTQFRRLIVQNVAAGCTMMVNSALVRRMKQVPAEQFMHVHDWWAMLVAAAFGRIDFIDEPTSLYRQHADNSIGAVRYSVTKISLAEDRRLSIERRFRQAQSFLEVYGDELPRACRRPAGHQAAMLSADSWPSRLLHQVASGAWRWGLRGKVGQVDMALRFHATPAGEGEAGEAGDEGE